MDGLEKNRPDLKAPKTEDAKKHFIPLTIEREGVSFDVFVLSDIDGTVNNEYLPESKRIESIEPARKAFSELEAKGIPVGLVSARSYGEVEMYRQKLGINGQTIFEDGGGIALPTYDLDPQKIKILSTKFRLVKHGEKNVLLLSSITTEHIKRFLQEIENDTGERMVSSCTSTALELQRAAGHPTLVAAQLSMERLVSAYAVGLSAKQRKPLEQRGAERGIRTFTSTADAVTLFFGLDAHKGYAIEVLCEYTNLFFPNRNSEAVAPFPIVIGNHNNDIPLFEKALSYGGMAILVAKEDGSYAASLDSIPHEVVKIRGAYGFGIQEATRQIFDKLKL